MTRFSVEEGSTLGYFQAQWENTAQEILGDPLHLPETQKPAEHLEDGAWIPE